MCGNVGGSLLVVWRPGDAGRSPGDCHRAADRARADSVRCARVPSVRALGPRCRRAAPRARPGRGPHDHRALGPARRARTRGAAAPSSPAPKKSWRVDETGGRVKGRWCDLSRALDSPGATIDVVLSGVRDDEAAPCLCRKALTVPSQPQPRVITTDHARLCGAAISGVNKEGLLRPRGRPRPIPDVNHILEPAHRALTRRVTATQGFVNSPRRGARSRETRPGT